jgi:hypothetical protein
MSVALGVLDLGVMKNSVRQTIGRRVIRRMKSATTHERLKIVHMDETKYRGGIGRRDRRVRSPVSSEDKSR